MKTRNQAPSIVILGGGFAGAYCAQTLERELRSRRARILLLDRNNYFIFYPFLVEAGTGNLQPRHAVVPIRAFLRSATFRMADVIGVDTGLQKVTYQLAGAEIVQTAHYDHLVVALGSVTRMPAVPGLREHGYEIKSVPDAIALRDRAIQLLELAEGVDDPARRRALLHLVIVGASFTGAEVAGSFHEMLRRASRQYPGLKPDDCRVTLVEMADRILPALDRDLSTFAEQRMRRRGIDVRLNTTVTAVHGDHVVLQPTGGQGGEEILPTHTTIWCAGIEPSPLVRKLPLPTDRLGYILCEPDLRVKGFDNVWGIGDCAVNPGPQGNAYPPTAQHAVREGKHLARNIARTWRGQAPEPFVYRSQGALAALGCRTGVAKVFDYKLSGFAAWFLWRTVYLTKMPGIARKIRVAMDWTIELLLGRDEVQLGVHRLSRRGPEQVESQVPVDAAAKG